MLRAQWDEWWREAKRGFASREWLNGTREGEIGGWRMRQVWREARRQTKTEVCKRCSMQRLRKCVLWCVQQTKARKQSGTVSADCAKWGEPAREKAMVSCVKFISGGRILR